jgi:uncharacterized protein YuzE
MRTSVKYDNETGIVYATVRKGEHFISDQINYPNATIVIDKDKKGNVLGVEII